MASALSGIEYKPEGMEAVDGSESSLDFMTDGMTETKRELGDDA